MSTIRDEELQVRLGLIKPHQTNLLRRMKYSGKGTLNAVTEDIADKAYWLKELKKKKKRGESESSIIPERPDLKTEKEAELELIRKNLKLKQERKRIHKRLQESRNEPPPGKIHTVKVVRDEEYQRQREALRQKILKRVKEEEEEDEIELEEENLDKAANLAMLLNETAKEVVEEEESESEKEEEEKENEESEKSSTSEEEEEEEGINEKEAENTLRIATRKLNEVLDESSSEESETSSSSSSSSDPDDLGLTTSSDSEEERRREELDKMAEDVERRRLEKLKKQKEEEEMLRVQKELQEEQARLQGQPPQQKAQDEFKGPKFANFWQERVAKAQGKNKANINNANKKLLNDIFGDTPRLSVPAPPPVTTVISLLDEEEEPVTVVEGNFKSIYKTVEDARKERQAQMEIGRLRQEMEDEEEKKRQAAKKRKREEEAEYEAALRNAKTIEQIKRQQNIEKFGLETVERLEAWEQGRLFPKKRK